MTTREKIVRKDDKRKIIGNGAARVFAKKGFDKTTTRDIAKAAKISAASVYYYFDSKEDLLYQILDETISTGLALIGKIEKSDRDLKHKLAEILLLHTGAAVDYNKMKLLVHEAKSLYPRHRKAISKKQSDYVKHLTRILDTLKRNGEIVDLDTTVCAFAFFGMVSWAYRWYNPKGKIKPTELARTFRQIFTEGIFRASAFSSNRLEELKD